MPEPLDELIAAVRAGAKYRQIDPGLIGRLGARELAARGNLKQAVKATRARLHQIAGAYLDRPPAYPEWLARLRAAEGPAERRAVCRALMTSHASTSERLPDLERIYADLFGLLPPVGRLLDLACGLNPLAIPWMPLAQGAHYQACDLYLDLADFLTEAIPLLGCAGGAGVCDLAAGPPAEPADVALVLKTLPVLEQLRRGAARELLRSLNVGWLVVSFPTRSLGGRNVGMERSYTAMFSAIAEAEGWPYQSLSYPSELIFVARKRPS